MLAILGLAALAYFLGAIPFGYLTARARGVDLTKMGSGNIGSTNVYRALGLPAAVLVFLLDAGKGLAAVRLVPRIAAVSLPPGVAAEHVRVVCGIAVVIGSIASVFMRFRGGKAVATGAGVFLGMEPLPTGLAIALWAALVAAFRYVSVGSIAAAAALPMLVAAFRRHGLMRNPVFWLALAVAITVIVRHRANVARLVRGTEHKVGNSPGRVKEKA